MREYKIYKTDLWWSIYRKLERWKFIYMQFLDWHNSWTTNKDYARIFYHREIAVSALVIVKAKDETRKTREESD
jgi:hypothetical protein